MHSLIQDKSPDLFHQKTSRKLFYLVMNKDYVNVPKISTSCILMLGSTDQTPPLLDMKTNLWKKSVTFSLQIKSVIPNTKKKVLTHLHLQA